MVQRTNTTACMIKKNIFKCSQMGHSHSRHINLWTYSFYESSLWRQKTHIKPSQPFNIWENDTPSNFSPLSLELKGSLYVAMRLLWIFLFHKSSLQDLETGYVHSPQICKVVWVWFRSYTSMDNVYKIHINTTNWYNLSTPQENIIISLWNIISFLNQQWNIIL